MSAFGNSPLTLGGNALSVPSGSTPVGGPGTSTDNAIARWDGTGGNLIQNSVLIVADTTGALSGFTTGAGLTFHEGGTLTGASGALTLTASGTNQNITLTPSGTGFTQAKGGSTAAQALLVTTSAFTLGSAGSALYFGHGATSGDTYSRIQATDVGGSSVSYLVLNNSGGAVLVGTVTDVAGNLQVASNALASTSTVGISMRNETAATGGATVQMSPAFRLRGNAWNTSASQTVDFFIENLPTSAATPTGTLKFGYSLNGAAATYPMQVSSAGALTTAAGITATTGNINSTAGEIQTGGNRVNYNLSAYGAGTAYAFTNTAAAIDFGTTDPAIVLDKVGTYLISGQVNIAYNGATVAAETATIKVRRTNNTAADLSAVVVLDLPAATTLTHTYGIFQIPPFIYTTAATDDAVTLFANVSAALGAGTIDATAIGTSIVAQRLY